MRVGVTMAITQAQIFEVADRLDAEGVNPTLVAVRKALGSGSFSTLSEAMRVWRERRARRLPSSSNPIPELVRERLEELGTELWAHAEACANSHLARDREVWCLEQRRLDGELQEAIQTADEVTCALDVARSRIDALEQAAEQFGREVAALERKLARAGERAAVAEVRALQLEEQIAALSAAMATLQATHHELVCTVGKRGLTDHCGNS